MTVVAAGILFSRTIRSSFASFTLAPLPADSSWSSLENATQSQAQQQRQQQQQPFLLRIQFQGNLVELRSFCRKHYKLGDHLEFHESPPKTCREDDGDNATRPWFQQPRWVATVNTPEEATEIIVVHSSQVWNMTQCQAFQKEFLVGFNKDSEPKKLTKIKTRPSRHQEDERRCNHGTDGKVKRLLAEEVVRHFLKALGEERFPTKQQHSDQTPNEAQLGQIRDFLNHGCGVLDVAGGAGHVSMALGSIGIKSTIIDSRSTAGILPHRDRKIWKRRLKNRHQHPKDNDNTGTLDHTNSPRKDDFFNELGYCQVVPFETQRAWFGSKPKSFRHPDEVELPVVSVTSNGGGSSSSLLDTASALIALHPDEATAEIVQAAVQRKLPFCIVPCCVFSRVFPDRRTKDGNEVTNYDDLLKFCREKDASIRQTQLPFEGKNIALWSTFSDTTSRE